MKRIEILIVEDEPSNREVAEVILSRCGHRVTTCGNGVEALDLCLVGGQEFDVILMDVLMPIMNGLEATRRLRADSRTRDLPIICLSARASGLDRETGVRAGADAYLTKPYTRRALLGVIDEVLRRKGMLSDEDSIAS